MKKRILLICAVLLVSVIALVSCSDDPTKNNKAIGNWFYDNGYELFHVTISLEVKSDKTCTMVYKSPETEDTASGTWTATSVTEGTASFTIEGAGTQSGTFVVNGDKLTFTPDGQPEEAITFDRVVK